jgi:hypothetical protein
MMTAGGESARYETGASTLAHESARLLGAADLARFLIDFIDAH